MRSNLWQVYKAHWSVQFPVKTLKSSMKLQKVLQIRHGLTPFSTSERDIYVCGYELIRRDELENLCIEIRKPNSKPFIVVNWYRPPNFPIGLFSHLENLIARLDLTNLEFFPPWWYECRYGIDQQRQQCPSTSKHCWYLWPPPTHFWAYSDHR